MTLSDDIARRRALAEAADSQARPTAEAYLEAHHPGVVKALWDVAAAAEWHDSEGKKESQHALRRALDALAAAMREVLS